jgi:hypothetical protein
MTADATVPTPYLAPDVGFDALKSAVALIRCCADGDGEGIGAIINGAANLHELAGMTATIAAIICLRVSRDRNGIDALLAAVSSDLTNLLLDQEKPAGGGD